MVNKDIEKLYRELGEDKTSNTQIYETIIESKHQDSKLVDVKQSLYCDIKGWCCNYISSKQEKDYGYDTYNRSKIKEKIYDSSLTAKQRLGLINYVKYILSQYNDDGSWLNSDATELKLTVLKKENWFKFILKWSSSKIRRSLITILIFFVVELVFLLPAPFEWMELFDLQQVNYSECGWLNYIANVVAVKLDWIDGPHLVCLNWRGVMAMGLWMVLYIVFVVNILFNNIISDITDYDE